MSLAGRGGRRWAPWRRNGDRGAEPVEFAIVASVMIIVTFVVIQVGLVYYARSIALGAATHGVSVGRAFNASDTAAGNAAENFLDQAGDGLEGRNVTVDQDADEIEVIITGTAISVVPGMTFSVRQSARGSIEQPTS